jgi:iron complex transport system ATP-binding protein
VTDEVLAFHRAEVRVDGRSILGPVSWTVRPGEQWVVLGPNGSGKTTLLSLAGARRQPSRGEVRVLGEPVGAVDVRRLRRRIGHVSHAVADRLRPTITALEVVLTGKSAALETWWQDLDDDDRIAAHGALADAGCGDLADRAIATLSMGERQRVLLARARFGGHELLLFDEPAAGLDLPAREALLGAMTAATSATTVLATHHLEEIAPIVTHGALLRAGELVAAGPVRDVLAEGPLSACFGIDVVVSERDGRFTARAR